jgi:hypothetical protein
MFSSILTETTNGISVTETMLCMGTAIVLGIFIAYIYQFLSDKHSKNFLITLALLPILVQVVIMMVNGNLGTSVAIMGAFGLVRFRSAAGTSREISAVFFSMAVGLATGMGYLVFAACFTVIVSIVFAILSKSNFGEKNTDYQTLRITIPENLDYTEVFDDIFSKYLNNVRLDRVKTTNMGSMFELQYQVLLKDPKEQKQMIDEIRCRNGNLTVICARPVTDTMEL